ncbi:hypothetical protein GCM10023169_17160 [Georgenia halophila]|uniref:Uncharacterized protein n=1 Tax=Georgenia halophila TaxID=620889 RepID=A0ABP8L5C4_9MICO
MKGFDPVRVLSVWGADLPAEQIHVVTAPAAGGSPEQLWYRFLGAVDVPPSWAPHEAVRVNASVGIHPGGTALTSAQSSAR